MAGLSHQRTLPDAAEEFLELREISEAELGGPIALDAAQNLDLSGVDGMAAPGVGQVGSLKSSVGGRGQFCLSSNGPCLTASYSF